MLSMNLRIVYTQNMNGIEAERDLMGKKYILEENGIISFNQQSIIDTILINQVMYYKKLQNWKKKLRVWRKL